MLGATIRLLRRSTQPTPLIFTAVQVRPKRIFRRDAVNYILQTARLIYCVHRRRSDQVCHTALYTILCLVLVVSVLIRGEIMCFLISHLADGTQMIDDRISSYMSVYVSAFRYKRDT